MIASVIAGDKLVSEMNSANTEIHDPDIGGPDLAGEAARDLHTKSVVAKKNITQRRDEHSIHEALSASGSSSSGEKYR